MVSAARAGLTIAVERASATRWASATFTGARHQLVVIADNEPGAWRWVAGLPEADLPVRGHLVADLVANTVAHDGSRFTATIEALTVEER